MCLWHKSVNIVLTHRWMWTETNFLDLAKKLPLRNFWNNLEYFLAPLKFMTSRTQCYEQKTPIVETKQTFLCQFREWVIPSLKSHKILTGSRLQQPITTKRVMARWRIGQRVRVKSVCENKIYVGHGQWRCGEQPIPRPNTQFSILISYPSRVALGDNPFFTWMNIFFEWIILDFLNE